MHTVRRVSLFAESCWPRALSRETAVARPDRSLVRYACSCGVVWCGVSNPSLNDDPARVFFLFACFFFSDSRPWVCFQQRVSNEPCPARTGSPRGVVRCRCRCRCDADAVENTDRSLSAELVFRRVFSHLPFFQPCSAPMVHQRTANHSQNGTGAGMVFRGANQRMTATTPH